MTTTSVSTPSTTLRMLRNPDPSEVEEAAEEEVPQEVEEEEAEEERR